MKNKMLAVISALVLPAAMLTACGDVGSTESAVMKEASSYAPAEGAAPEASADDVLKGDDVLNDMAVAGEEAADDGGFDESFKGDFEVEGAAEREIEPPLEPLEPEDPPVDPPAPMEDDPFILTAGEWNDNDNWGFFTNLVTNGNISFPAFGLNPTGRVAVRVENDGAPVRNQKIYLMNGDDVVWSAYSDKAGNAYLFYPPSISADTLYVQADGSDEKTEVKILRENDGQSSTVTVSQAALTLSGTGTQYEKTEVMFILDTTGSMGDEISYLQKDFSAIAGEVAAENVTFSVNFYRDHGDDYVTLCNPFTADVKDVQTTLNQQYAGGGGDTPEAVAEILTDTITNGEWSEDSNKIAFLIFDAPPHDDMDEEIYAAIYAAAQKGIHLVPVVASNAERETELFGRAAAIMTNSNYVFLTDDSGVGDSHLEPIIGDYDVELLHDIIVRNIREIMA